MDSKRPLFQEMLAEDLNSRFIKEFVRRIPTIYQEAKSRSVDDDAVDVALKPYCFGQTRYTLIQSLFLSVGRECGHDAKIVLCESNGFPIPQVSIGRFHFTTHHGLHDEEGSAINSSLIRKQNSQINDEIVNPTLFGCTFDEKKLRAAENIYANFLYGCRSDSQDFATYGFLHIAVPYLKKVQGAERLFYAANHDYSVILKMVLEREKTTAEQKPIINVAAPKLKKPQNPPKKKKGEK